MFYWLSEKVDEKFLKRWLKVVEGVDHSLFCPNEPHFVARPVLDPGVFDPVPIRSKLIPGEVDVVTVPNLPEPARRRSAGPSSVNIPPWRGSDRARAYAYACLRALAEAPPGQGRATCTNVALRLYGLAKAGKLDAADVTGRIKRIMLDRGWDADEATRGMTLADINRQLTWAWERAPARDLGA